MFSGELVTSSSQKLPWAQPQTAPPAAHSCFVLVTVVLGNKDAGRVWSALSGPSGCLAFAGCAAPWYHAQGRGRWDLLWRMVSFGIQFFRAAWLYERWPHTCWMLLGIFPLFCPCFPTLSHVPQNPTKITSEPGCGRRVVQPSCQTDGMATLAWRHLIKFPFGSMCLSPHELQLGWMSLILSSTMEVRRTPPHQGHPLHGQGLTDSCRRCQHRREELSHCQAVRHSLASASSCAGTWISSSTTWEMSSPKQGPQR